MEYLIFVIGIFAVSVITSLITSNISLSKENKQLLINNSELFHQVTNTSWQLETTKSELKIIKAEYGIKDPAPKRKNHVINCVEKGKQSPHCE